MSSRKHFLAGHCYIWKGLPTHSNNVYFFLMNLLFWKDLFIYLLESRNLHGYFSVSVYSIYADPLDFSCEHEFNWKIKVDNSMVEDLLLIIDVVVLIFLKTIWFLIRKLLLGAVPSNYCLNMRSNNSNPFYVKNHDSPINKNI